MGKRIVSFRIERSAIELMDSKNKSRASVARDAINSLIQEDPLEGERRTENRNNFNSCFYHTTGITG